VMGKRQRANKIGAYVAVPKTIMEASAWRAMAPGARLLWIELRGWLRSDWSNNGRLFRSDRDAAKAIGIDKSTVVRKYAENEHFGFLRKTSGGFLGLDGHGIAANYRFTDLPYDTHPATRDYAKWDGSPFVYRPRRPAQKKQNPVRTVRTPRPHRADIRKVANRGAVCTHHADIGSPPRRPHHADITSLPLPPSGEEHLQGSSTARAPAQAGGAGSSPAPVAKPDLTTMVLDIVTAQLNELESRTAARALA
jgi:hypothetical protein